MLAVAFFGVGCGPEHSSVRRDTGDPTPTVVVGTCREAQCYDFPDEPLTFGAVPYDIDRLFVTSPGSQAGACLVEPPDGAMLPNNWLPPRIRFIPSPDEDLWQITLSSRVEQRDLVVYTTRPMWTMDQDTWNRLATHAAGEVIDITVRGVNSQQRGAVSRTRGSFEIAPVQADGTIVYWAADGFYNVGGETKLVGFRVGDTSTIDALSLPEVQEFPALDRFGEPKAADQYGQEGKVRCIGCHTSTPDGDAVAFVDSWPWNSVVASVVEDSVGQRPDYVTESAARILQQPWQGTPTFSDDHWETGARIMIQSFGSPDDVGWPGTTNNATGKDRLVWFDLACRECKDPLPESGSELDEQVQELQDSAFGFLERRGDPRGAVNPDWSHSGNTVAYVSASETLDGHGGGRPIDPKQQIETDIYQVPFNDGAGGDASPLVGASEPGIGEYYPDYSADDRFIAFTRTPSTQGQVYYRPDGEIWVVPASGGKATRLKANDPPQCTGEVSPGVINSWPKWSPSVATHDGKTYYWLIFSSARSYPAQFTLARDAFSPAVTASSQLYIAAVVAEGDEIVKTYPAIYLYNQTTNTTNLTPAWDEFQIATDEIR